MNEFAPFIFQDRLFQLVLTGSLDQLDSALDDPTVNLRARDRVRITTIYSDAL